MGASKYVAKKAISSQSEDQVDKISETDHLQHLRPVNATPFCRFVIVFSFFTHFKFF